MESRIHPVAMVGNAAVLVALMLALVSVPGLVIGQPQPSSGSTLPPWCGSAASLPNPPADRVVLVIVDALRADAAVNPQIMPSLCRLAVEGRQTTMRVESLVPCTIAAITTFGTGRVPPPTVFLQDFHARPAVHGGLFAQVVQHRKSIFVAGPKLWTEVYGTWIADAEVDTSFGHQDERLLGATLSRLARGRHELIILHLSHLDHVAHQFGGESSAYSEAVRRCDRAIEQVAAALTQRDCLIVTSDHGSTARGGHAGPEPEVVQTPLIMWGSGLPSTPLPALAQHDLPRLICQTMEIQVPTTDQRVDPSATSAWSGGPITAAVLIGFWGLWCYRRVASIRDGPALHRRFAFVLNTSVWIVLGLMLCHQWRAALAGTCLSLLAISVKSNHRPSMAAPRIWTAGLMLAGVRWLEGWNACFYRSLEDEAGEWTWALLGAASLMIVVACERLPRTRMGLSATSGLSRRRLPPLLGGVILSWLGGGTVASIGFATAYALGMVLAAVVGPLTDRRTGIANLRVAPASLAILVVVSSVVLSRLLGRGISLSTLDLQRAIQIADEGGPVWAASIAALSAAVPLLGLFGGLAPLLARLTYEQTAHFAAGLATMGLAQLGLAAWLLSGWSSSPAVDSLAFGFLLSAMGELVIGFLILGSVILCQEGLAKFIF